MLRPTILLLALTAACRGTGRAVRGVTEIGAVTPANERTPARGAPTITSVVRGHEPELRYCYEQALARDRALEGALTVAVAIDGLGTATRVDVVERRWRGGPGGAGLEAERCVRTQIRSWLFPSRAAGTYRFPIRLMRR